MQQILYWVLVEMAEHWARSFLHFHGPRLRLCAQKRNKELGQHPPSSYTSSQTFSSPEPVSQRIWTPRGFGPPRSRSASGFGPPGPNPLADMDPLSRIWTPLKTSVLLSKIGEIVFWSC